MQDFYEPANYYVGQEIVNNRNTKTEFIVVEKNAKEYKETIAKEKEMINRGKMSRKLKFTLWILFGLTVAILIAIIIGFVIYTSIQVIHVNPAIVSSLTNSPNILDYPQTFEDAEPKDEKDRVVKFDMDQNKIHYIEPRNKTPNSQQSDLTISAASSKKKKHVTSIATNSDSDDEERDIAYPVFTLPQIRGRNRQPTRIGIDK